MAYLLFFVFGVAIGVAGRHAWGDAMRLKMEDEAAKKWDEMNAEIKRLRAQVALHIGRENPPSTCCGDATHGCMGPPR